MIKQIAACCGEQKRLSPQERGRIASYLNGEIGWREVKQLLPKGGGAGYRLYHQDAAAIISSCREGDSYSSLGRYLRVLRHLDEELFQRFVDNLLSAGYSMEQVFLDTALECGSESLLHRLFGDAEMPPEAVALLDRLVVSAPGDVEAFALSVPFPASLRPLAHLCAKRGLDPLESVESDRCRQDRRLASRLAGSMLSAFAGTMLFWGDGALARFGAALNLQCPQIADVWQGSISRNAGSFAGGDGGRACTRICFSALHLTRYSLETVNCMARAAFTAHPGLFVDGLLWALEERMDDAAYPVRSIRSLYRYTNLTVSEQSGAVEERLDLLAGVFRRLDLPREGLCAWAANRMPYLPAAWRPGFDRFFGGNPRLLEGAVQMAGPMARVLLYRRLYDLGRPLELSRCVEALRVLLPAAEEAWGDREADRFLLWLTQGGDEYEVFSPQVAQASDGGAFPGYERFASPHCDFDQAVWCLIGVTPMPGRLIRFLTHHRQGVRVDLFLQAASDYHGMPPAEIAGFLHKHCGVRAAARCLMDSVGREFATARPIALPVLRELGRMCPEELDGGACSP